MRDKRQNAKRKLQQVGAASNMHPVLSLVALSLASLARAAIGPSTNLYILNRDISPDGFNRSAVLAGATPNSVSMPGPLISGNMGDTFRINVMNQLNDTTMVTTTSV
ncbi:hypothetical protein AX15_004552, partial [Amanita polypyramis BW_CC]